MDGFRSSWRGVVIGFGLIVVAARVAPAQSGDTGLDGQHDGLAFVFESKDGSFGFSPTARLQVDAAAYFSSATPLSNGTAVRRARLGFEAVLFTDWEVEFDVDFADNEIELKDAVIAYSRIARSLIKVGQFKEPFGLEQTTSSGDITLMERAYTDALSPDRAIGFSFSRWGERWLATAALFGEDAGAVDETGHDEGVAWVLQARAVPVKTDRTRVQVGAAVSRRTPAAADTGTMTFASRPESAVSQVRFLDTGPIGSVRHTDRLNLEGLFIAGPLSAQVEWTRVAVFRDDVNALEFDGGYAMISYFLTGESRTYRLDKAEFDEVRPRRRGGAWEVAARYSAINLNDEVLGGGATNYTAGVTWYANSNIKWMLNYTHVRNDRFAGSDSDPAAAGDRFSFLQARMALSF